MDHKISCKAELSCILHTGQYTSEDYGKIIAFDEDHWKKTISAKGQHSNQKLSKYSNICQNLPDKISQQLPQCEPKESSQIKGSFVQTTI